MVSGGEPCVYDPLNDGRSLTGGGVTAVLLCGSCWLCCPLEAEGNFARRVVLLAADGGILPGRMTGRSLF